MGLTEYKRKRRFDKTPEPSGNGSAHGKEKSRKPGLQYVVQKHAASRLHYDFRLEVDGVLKSWAVPKGPSLDPAVKALAVQVEDHPVEYGSFEGMIPPNQYGAGTVMLWDRGTWQPESDPKKGLRDGKLKFELKGEKLHGHWMLLRMGGRAGDGGKNWLLKKLQDTEAQSASDYDVLEARPESIKTGRSLDEISSGARSPTKPRTRSRAKTTGAKRKATKAIRKGSTRGLVSRQASPRRSSSRKGTRKSTRISPGSLPGARRGRQPESFSPQKATLVRQIPEGDDWIHELKFDGYRLIGILRDRKVRLITRRGNDWTARFPSVAAAAKKLRVKDAILDGEVVVLGPGGKTSFQALQNLLQRQDDRDVVWYVFDVPYYQGYDLTQTPLLNRKELLQQLLPNSTEGVIRYSDHIVGQGPAAFASACQRGLEGLISKRATSPYQQRRSDDWVKVKCLGRQEFVIVGWTDPSGARSGFGALLLGYYDASGDLTYAGKVGTGFSSQSLLELTSKLRRLERNQSPLAKRLSGMRGVHWVQPQLVAEVEFTEWTDDGRLRHPSFQGLREDKKPHEIVREKPAASPSKRRPR